VTFAAAYEEMPREWGVGRVVIGEDVTPWPVSEADIEDEAESLAARLAELGLGDGDLVFIASLLSQAIHVVPFEKAAGKVGALYSSSDATPFDAFRTEALVRQLEPKVVLGIDSPVVDGLDELGHDLGTVFASVGAVVASDVGARDRLVAAGVSARGWVKLGATSTVQALGDDAFAYDATRWQVDDDGGRLLITNVAPRLTESQRFDTGVRGQVVEPGRLRLTDWG
jgi:hypothetical protein